VIQKINDRVSVIFTEEGFTKSNALFIEDDMRVMIDSGPGNIIEQIMPEKVDILLNSHCHLDHIWDNDRFINSRIFFHPEEKENLKNFRKIVPVEMWDSLMDGDPNSFLNTILSMKESFLEEWRVDGIISEGDVISAGNTEIQVMHTPGHTSGHLSFFLPDDGILFCGDICLSKVGPWYGDEVTPLDDFIKSIDRIIGMKPEKVVSGHNREVLTEKIRETFEEYRERIYKREKKILQVLKQNKPLSIDEMAAMFLIYPEHLSVFVLYWEKSMIVKHLKRLIEYGLAEETGNGRFTAKK
jgi:glyoxylase-like metal-dependent hydrolase (beta-lactamase superfamily II)